MPTVSQKTLQVITTPSSNDIVPQDIQNELMTIREFDRLSRFRIGDLSAGLYDNHRAAGNGEITKSRVRRAIGYYLGKSERTIRYYEAVASFYPQETREKYAQLPFDAFDLAKQHANWEQVLDHAQKTLCSMDALEVAADKLSRGLDPAPPQPTLLTQGATSTSPNLPISGKLHAQTQIIFTDYKNLLDSVRQLILNSFVKVARKLYTDGQAQDVDRIRQAKQKAITALDELEQAVAEMNS